MLPVIIIWLGLCFGSFINALVWRLRQQEKSKKLSVLKGRSMCPKCRHILSPLDLIPVLSWVLLGGKCRYCKKPISPQYPIVELLTAALFVASYVYFPHPLLLTINYILLSIWLAILTGLIALAVYDLKWMILPDKIVKPLVILAGLHWLVLATSHPSPESLILPTTLSLFVSSGLFYVLFQASKGKWIGGGDIKLGLIFGLLLADPLNSGAVLFVASLLGTIIVLPQMIGNKLSLKAQIPFGPLLIAGTIVIYLFGERVINGYLSLLGL